MDGTRRVQTDCCAYFSDSWRVATFAHRCFDEFENGSLSISNRVVGHMASSFCVYEHLFVKTVPVGLRVGKHVFDFYLTSNKCSGLVEHVFEQRFGRAVIGCHTPVAQLNRWLTLRKKREI